MVRIGMGDVPADAIGRYHNHWNPGTVAEEIERLDIARIPGSATFIEGDEDRGFGPERLIGLDAVDDILDEAFEQIEFRGRWMAIHKAARLDVGHGRQHICSVPRRDRSKEARVILQVSSADR